MNSGTRRIPPGISRRTFVKAAAAAAAAFPGCLFNARTELPKGHVTWKTFRFVHLTGLHLAYQGDRLSHRWARRCAERVRAVPEVDFLLLGGGLVENSDPLDFMLLEEFLLTADLPWYAVPGEKERFKGGGAKTDFERRARDMGGRAWEAPWEDSPLAGVRLVGLDTGVPGRDAHARIEEQIPFLTASLDRHPEDAVLVLLHRPLLVPGRVKRLGFLPVESEMLRFVLEAAPNVKMALSGAAGAAFVKSEAGLLCVGTPPLNAFPHLFREITISRHGAVIRNRVLGAPWEREEERKDLARSPEARRFNPAFPEAYAEALEGERGRKVYELR